MTSTASARPRPEACGMSCCEITPSKTNESCARTCACWFAGKTSTIRVIDWTAEFVCSVASAKCPVSETVSAASIVSKSRSSPISTTSGSWRST